MATESGLETLRARYQMMVSSAPEAIGIVNVHTGRFVEVNEAACRLFGLTRDELLTRGPLELTARRHDEDAAALDARALRAVRAQRPVALDWNHLDGQGRPVPCRVLLAPVTGPAGRVLVRRVMLPQGDVAAYAELDRVTYEGVGAGGDAATDASATTVLLVDDEPLVRRAARAILEDSGLVVLEAADGLQAVGQFEAAPGGVDVVILDLTMPGLSGLEALERIRSLRAELPVILTSGHSETRAPADPYVSFLPKPFTPDALEQAIATALGRG